MAKLIYSAIASLDGYIVDEKGDYDWAAPDEQVHAYVNELEGAVGTFLLGRRMYQELIVWDTIPLDDQPPAIQGFARIWRAADKIVYSTTLEAASTARTRIEREFDPDPLRKLKQRSEHDLAVGGPGLAAHAFHAGLVDECHLFLHPILVGGGRRCLPDRIRLGLELLDERRFDSGVVHLRYRVVG